MLLAAGIDPNLTYFFLIGGAIFSLCLLLRFLRQPYAVAYILAGVMLGEDGFQLLNDRAIISSMGEFGLILLLFFIGMEISLPDLLKNWKIPAFGTLFQIGGSILAVLLVGQLLDWPPARIIITGFIISLSSSAVVIKILQDNYETQTAIGQNVISILLMQDILIVPMLIVAGYLGGQSPTTGQLILQLVGGLLIIGILLWVAKKQTIELPFSKVVEQDHELQVFVAFLICFGFAVLTAFLGLSAALGAFVGGIVVHAAQSAKWFHDSLHAFRVVFVAIFFLSIGMLIDLDFLKANWPVVANLVATVLLTNHLINSLYLKILW
ncbi:MAG: cation:proton antiporter [Bacteroidota bacterium]